MAEQRVLEFGPYRIDVATKTLMRDGEPVNLPVKSVAILCVLAEHAGQIVRRETVMQEVWPGRVVEEANLKQHIAVIRRALAAEAGSAAYIETFTGRGYRLVGPASLVAPPGNPEASPGGRVPESPSAPEPVRRSRRAVVGVGTAVVLSLTAALAWFLYRPQPPAPPVTITPVTRLEGQELQPEASPDGTAIAFIWVQEGKETAGVWTQRAGQTEPHLVTRKPGHYSSPVWSADGRWLAFLRTETGATEVVLAKADTGEERVVTRLVPPDYGTPHRLLDWSADELWLAVSHSGDPAKPLGLLLISTVTGERTQLTAPEGATLGDVSPRFSPDGRSLSFIRGFQRSSEDLFSIPAGGGAPRQITADQKRISAQGWMPDGRTLAFASSRAGAFRLWQVDAGAPGSRTAPQPTAIYAEYPLQFSIARRAPVLVYSVAEQSRSLFSLDLKTRTWTRILSSSAQDASPQYSPQGDKICFRSDRSNEEQLWVAASDGSGPVQVTQGPLWPSVGRWSPDGRSIVFNSSRTRQVYVTTRGDDGRWTPRLMGFRGDHPVFSPDGQWIYIGADDGIYRAPAGGGAGSVLARVKGISLGVSVDGKSLYFVRKPNDTTLWQASTQTGALSKALDGLLPGCTSCWAAAPDGIYFLGYSRNLFDRQTLYFHEFASGKDREVAGYPEPLTPSGSGPFSLSPDFRRLLCVRMRPAGADVMRVEPFR